MTSVTVEGPTGYEGAVGKEEVEAKEVVFFMGHEPP
jgi:hypothetical protein